MKKALMVCMYLVIYQIGYGQNLSAFAKQPFWKFGGNINCTFASQSYILSASLNPSIYGFTIPLHFSYSNEGAAYSHPFNQFSISPSYKWVKLYAGTTQLNLSPYSLNAHSFDGMGLELSPSNFPLQLTILYGRLKKKIDHILDTNKSSDLPDNNYQRMGWGGKLTYTNKKQSINFHYFRAEDKKNSILYPIQAPKQNTILGGDFNLSLFKKLNLFGSFALSELKHTALKQFPPRYGLETALKWGLGFQKMQISYERISPNYENLGAYYMQNDFENIVLSFQPSFKKIQISTNIGLQREDIRKEKQSRSSYWVGSVSLNIPVGSAIQLQASYSNFTSLTQVKPITLQEDIENPYLIIDTLEIRQISQQAQAGISHQWKSKTHKTNYIMSLQQSKESRQSNSTTYIFHSLEHSFSLYQKYILSISANLSSQKSEGKNVHTGGPSLTLSTSFWKQQLRVNFGSQYYLSNNSQSFFNNRISIVVALHKKHSLSASLFAQQKISSNQNNPNRLQFNISYSYLF